ncbi:MAG: AsmA-like C-terminal domain-containing protein [Epsilonproteobacteria bacterium]|nr:AsmA-like C-terminal domain-containing protein [Campylobacterota bacterium]
MSLIVIFIVLQNGLYLEKLSVSNLTVKNVYIKWNEKLNISAQEIDINTNQHASSKTEYQDIARYLKLISRFFLLTESIIIEKLKYNDISISIDHNIDKKGFLHATAADFDFKAHFQFQNQYFVFTIEQAKALKKKIKLDGKIIINLQDKKLYSKLHLLLNNDADLLLYAVADKNRVDYTITSQKDIEHIHELVALFHLPKEIKFWTSDAIDAKSLTLKKFHGFLQYNDLSNAYRHLYVTADINKLNYTYNPELDAIHTKKTALELKNGILYIHPKEAYSYGMYLDKSWLKIDFTKPQELLALHLLFNDGMLNKDMLRILASYKIQLPFLQHSGKVKTNLILAVNLMTLKIDAHGTFSTQKANFDYLGLNIDTEDMFITLDNYDIGIKMKAQYKYIADANVSVDYNAQNSTGVIKFKVTKIELTKDQRLDVTKKPLSITYDISPKGDMISVEKSNWIVKGIHKNMHLSVDAMQIPFALKTMRLHIPTTYFAIQEIADGFITGEINLKALQADLQLDLLNFKYQGIKLDQSNTQLDLHYNKHLSITAANDIFLTVNGSQYKLKGLVFKVQKNKLLLEHAKLEIGKYINTEIDVDYDLKANTADINLKNFILINPASKKILYYKHALNLALTTPKDAIKVTSKQLRANFMLDQERWVLNLDSLGTIAKNSDFLEKFNITNGKVSFYKKNHEKYTKFKGSIYYKYKLLTQKDKIIKKYAIKGYITKNQHIYFNVNDKVNVKVDKDININFDKCGLNTDGLVGFINFLIEKTKDSTSKEKPLNIFVSGTHSYLYMGNNRYVISDKMDLQFYNGIVTAQLMHANGKAGFKLQNNIFHLYGSGFNDKFMEKLLSLSKFNGGSLDFSMKSTFSDYTGIFYIKNTTIQDYVLLNNILAFINTVPSLATFSLPGYNTKGLYVDNAYMNFHLKDHIFDISDIYIGSKEIKIIGKGKASIKYNNIDLALNLKTDLGSNLSKVPLVGYIIFDGKSISTTLKVTGKLTDPKVETMLARDIAVAPLNIILRTLTLPYKIVKDITTDKNSSKK